jgi:regulatory protein
MQITKLAYQKTDPNRIDIYVDNNLVADLDASDVLRLGLFKNQELSQSNLDQIVSDSERGKLFNFAVNFLSFRPRSRQEIRDHLLRKIVQGKKIRIPNEKSLKQVDEVLHRLEKLGQANDEAFASWFIDQRRTFRPSGKRALQFELHKKGLDKKIVEQALSSAPNSLDKSTSELDLASRALSKKAARLIPTIADSKSKLVVKMKLQRFLLSRGFDYDTVKKAVEKALK